MAHGKVGDLKVVEAVRRDIPQVRTFILDAWMIAGSSAWGWTGASEENVQGLASSEHLTQLISNPKVRILLAREDGRIVGLAATRESDAHTLELAGIIVDERHTGKGVGTALAKKALGIAADSRYKEVLVKTETFNKRALAFYGSMGFVQTGVTTEDVDGKSITLSVLKRKLS
ncbi:MAG TPA: GNAT family N-acetyltransferase [Nitrososphaerales archaeon]|nr:GNAT family N-acetyltransferase [Nitrososphaerales archaeon]